MNYTGYRIIEADDELLSKIYLGDPIDYNFLENEYCLCVQGGKPIDYLQFRNGKLKHIAYPQCESVAAGVLKPRNPEQYFALDMLKNTEIPIKLLTGKFGSGKTLLYISAALEALQKNQFEKIVLVRNNIPVKDTDDLGALPGSVWDKTLPYMMPFADHCGGVEGMQHFIENGQLEVVALGHLRGRSIRNAILYSMESENLTKQHIQLLMGRIDTGSQLWLDGDVQQRDKDIFVKSQGLEIMIDRLKGHRLFGYVHLIKSERSEVSQMADLLD